MSATAKIQQLAAATCPYFGLIENNMDESEDQMKLVTQARSISASKPPAGEKKPRRRRRKVKDELALKKKRLSAEQVNYLEECFGDEQKLESGRKNQLASKLGLDPKQVSVWFQNKRARSKIKKIEEEYAKLKKINDARALETRHLHVENLSLKKKLKECEDEIQKLSNRQTEVFLGESINSSSSSFSVDKYYQAFMGEFSFDEFEKLLYPSDVNYVGGFNWEEYM